MEVKTNTCHLHSKRWDTIHQLVCACADDWCRYGDGDDMLFGFDDPEDLEDWETMDDKDVKDYVVNCFLLLF